MSHEYKVTCDHCGKDLTRTTNCVGWSIRVTNREIPSVGGMVTAMMIYPAFEKDLDFCHLGCFEQFFEKRWKKRDYEHTDKVP